MKRRASRYRRNLKSGAAKVQRGVAKVKRVGSAVRKGIMKAVPGRTQRVERNKFGRMVDVKSPRQQKRAAKRKKLESMIRRGYRP